MTVEVIVAGFKANEVYIVANSKTEIVTLNEEIVNFDANKFIEEIQEIVLSWDSKMVNWRVLDGSWYTVKINDGVNSKVFEGRNKYPANYNKFLELVKSVQKTQ